MHTPHLQILPHLGGRWFPGSLGAQGGDEGLGLLRVEKGAGLTSTHPHERTVTAKGAGSEDRKDPEHSSVSRTHTH